jgi:hypothetical protein
MTPGDGYRVGALDLPIDHYLGEGKCHLVALIIV